MPRHDQAGAMQGSTEDVVAALLHSSPELAAELVRRVLQPVLDLAPRERGLLLQTLRAWLENERSLQRSAAVLHCHRNTVSFRLKRLRAVLGVTLAPTAPMTELDLALRAHSMQQQAGRCD